MEGLAHAGSATGIRLERRTLLWLPIAATGGSLAVAAPVLAADEEEARARSQPEGAYSPLTREDFGRRWLLLAKELGLAPPEHDESYAAQLAGLIARVPIEALPELENPRARNGVSGGLSWRLLPCVTIEFRMDPGATLRLHNHPPQVVVTLCAEGEASYRHFEIEGDAPPCTEIGAEFRARETKAGILLPGRTTALTRLRDGIHGFVGGAEGARIIDFTLALSEDVETFSYIELSDAPLDSERRVYAAVWLGKSD